MRLAFKFTLVFVIGMCLVWGVAAHFQYQREIELFESDMRADDLMIGIDLSRAVAAIWQHSGQKEVLDFISEAAKRDDRIAVRWIAFDQIGQQSAEPGITPELIQRMASGTVPNWAYGGAENAKRLFTYVPVEVDGKKIGALEVSESLAVESQYVRATLIRTLITTFVASLLTVILALCVGISLVGRPVRRLIERARQIASGDLSGRVLIRRSDELGELASEINAMSDQLQSAYRRITAEEEAHQESVEQLRHANRLTTVGKLASSMAHELGTPLNVISARAKMIMAHEVEGDGLVESSRTILDMSNRMTQTMRQVLDLARRKPAQVVAIDLCQIIRQSISLLTMLARRRKVTLRFGGEEGPLFSPVDPDQIQQVLSNLIVNGLEAMPDGGNLVVSVTRKPGAQPSQDDPGSSSYLCISVRDEGEGISEENLTRVFNPFFTTKERTGGTGLGLSICADIVREHGGWIDVQSRPGEGSTFTVFLPEGSKLCEAVS